jgi:hypothetical protein
MSAPSFFKSVFINCLIDAQNAEIPRILIIFKNYIF